MNIHDLWKDPDAATNRVESSKGGRRGAPSGAPGLEARAARPCVRDTLAVGGQRAAIGAGAPQTSRRRHNASVQV
jgi:hypothetical protein